MSPDSPVPAVVSANATANATATATAKASLSAGLATPSALASTSALPWRPLGAKPATDVSHAVEQAIQDVRQKIYMRSVTGMFARWRLLFVGFTQLIFYAVPWLTWNDRQAVLFDLGARKFYIFGVEWIVQIWYVVSFVQLFLFLQKGF